MHNNKIKSVTSGLHNNDTNDRLIKLKKAEETTLVQ